MLASEYCEYWDTIFIEQCLNKRAVANKIAKTNCYKINWNSLWCWRLLSHFCVIQLANLKQVLHKGKYLDYILDEYLVTAVMEIWRIRIIYHIWKKPWFNRFKLIHLCGGRYSNQDYYMPHILCPVSFQSIYNLMSDVFPLSDCLPVSFPPSFPAIRV